jgi:hypothetical protein
LVRHADIELDGPVAAPTELFEERHVSQLDVGDHFPAAEISGGGDGEADQGLAESTGTEFP